MRQLKIFKSVTNRDEDSLEKFLQEMGRIPLLTAEEEVLLAQRIKTGDTLALKELTNANLRFVVSVAKQYQNQGLTLPDLIQEGNLGLIKAAQRFDETKGFKFVSYAVWWIRQSILQALAEDSRVVRLPLNQIGRINKINKRYSLLEQELERDPTEEEVAKSLDLETDEVANSLSIGKRQLSLDAPLLETTQDDGLSLYDIYIPNDAISVEDILERESLKDDIERVLLELKDQRQAQIIRDFYGTNGSKQLTLEEIGQKFNLTRERVRQLKEKGIRLIKISSKKKNLLRQYLG